MSKKRLPVLEDRLEHATNACVYIGDASHTLSWSIKMLEEASKELRRDWPSIAEKISEIRQRLIYEKATIESWLKQIQEVTYKLEEEVKNARGY